MLRKTGQLGLLFGAVLFASSCASQSKRLEEAPTTVEPCEGRLVLAVRNNTDVEMEIVESQRGSGGRVVIAVVGPGYSEVPIRKEPGFSYSARPVGGGATAAATSRPRVRDRAVTLNRVCKAG